MLHDYKGSEQIDGNYSSTLDLNGKTYTLTSRAGFLVEVGTKNSKEKIELKIINGSMVAAGGISPGGAGIRMPYPNTSITLENVNVTVVGDAYGIATNGNLKDNSITLINSTLNIKDGYGIYFPSEGKVKVEDSVINAKYVGVQMCSGELEVTGDKTAITVTGEPVPKTESDGAIADGASISLINRNYPGEEPTAKIEAGTFISNNGEAVKAYEWNGKTEEEWVSAAEKVEITGGIYSTDPVAYLEDDLTTATIANKAQTRTLYYIGQAAETGLTNVEAGSTVTINQVASGKTIVVVGDDLTIKNETNQDITLKVNGTEEKLGADGTITTPPYIPPTTPTTQHPTIETDANATVTLSTYGTIATITVADGYEIADVTLNGVSLGKKALVTGLKTGDKLVVTTVKKGETDAEKNARIKAGVEATTIKLKSTLGKGYIKLNWTKSAGYKVDYYEVFKSTKRYSGYGTDPYWITKTGGMKNSYKNTKELKKGTRYYYKVRGVREINGEVVYTEYSNKAWRTVK